MSFAGQTFLAKFQAGIASLVAGIVLGFVHYTDHVDAMEAVAAAGGLIRMEFPDIMNALWLITTILPAIGCLLAVIPTWKYPLTRKINEEIIKEVLEIREGTASKDDGFDFW